VCVCVCGCRSLLLNSRAYGVIGYSVLAASSHGLNQTDEAVVVLSLTVRVALSHAVLSLLSDGDGHRNDGGCVSLVQLDRTDLTAQSRQFSGPPPSPRACMHNAQPEVQ
jgi:hypothetical protein